jgi:hypothetical protein
MKLKPHDTGPLTPGDLRAYEREAVLMSAAAMYAYGTAEGPGKGIKNTEAAPDLPIHELYRRGKIDLMREAKLTALAFRLAWGGDHQGIGPCPRYFEQRSRTLRRDPATVHQSMGVD